MNKYFHFLSIIFGISLFTMLSSASLSSNPPSQLERNQQKCSLARYLKWTHSKMRAIERGERPLETVHIVIGNQSADMDSIMSAIAYSYSNGYRGLYVPVINIPKEELPLRGDVEYVLKTIQIDPGTFLYQEDLPFLLKLANDGCLRVTLVDHNRLSPDQDFFKDYVEQIIDHHQDEKDCYPLLLEEQKKIVKIGSTSTLIAQMILEQKGQLSSQEAYVLLSAILLDTRNLTNQDVTTEEDRRIATLLKQKAGSYYTDSLFDQLVKNKYSVEHLTPNLLLKKDYKRYREGKLLYGIASIPRGINWIPSNRSEWKGAFEESLKKQQIHLLAAIAYEGNETTFIVYIPKAALQEAFLMHIAQSKELDDELILKAYFPEEGLFFFTLKHPLTRKLLQPLLSFETSLSMQEAVDQNT